MKKIWVKKFTSFKKAEEAEDEYYSKMSPSERLNIIQFLRETYYKFKGGRKDDGGKRLRRTIKVIQQT